MRVLVVEDEVMLRESLASALGGTQGIEVVGTLGDAADALDVVRTSKVDLVLMDVCTENDSSGIVAAGQIKREFPNVRIVIMTGLPEVTFVNKAREAGVDSFVYKNIGTRELVTIMFSTMEGYSTYPFKQVSKPEGIPELDDEELAILRLTCMGMQRAEISRELHVSEATIKRRIANILAKTGYESMLKLSVHMISKGYIVPNIE